MFPFEPLEVYTLFDSVLPTSTGIYAIVNVTNGKYYIGSARGVDKYPGKCGFRFRFNRAKGHRRMLLENRHHSKYLQNAYNKVVEDGFDPNEVFQIWIIEYVESDCCIEVEDKYLENCELFYNMTSSASNPMKDRKQSPETCRLISRNSKFSKTYVGISPTGDVVQFTNSYEFIRNNPTWKFSQQNISNCANGRHKTHRGWRFMHYEDYIASDCKILPIEYAEVGKEYIAISSNGDVLRFKNAKQFCRDNPDWKFNHKNISGCVRGEKQSHRGWRFYYAEDYRESAA